MGLVVQQEPLPGSFFLASLQGKFLEIIFLELISFQRPPVVDSLAELLCVNVNLPLDGGDQRRTSW